MIIRTLQDEYKLVSSFFDNYCKEHIYEEIKEISLGVSDYKKTSHGVLIHSMLRFLSLVNCNLFCLSNKEIILDYEYSFKRKMRKETLKKEINESFVASVFEPFEAILKLLNLREQADLSENFLLFVLIYKIASMFYKQPIVIPLTFYEDECRVHNLEVKPSYVKALLAPIKCDKTINLKSDVLNAFKERKLYFIDLGVEHMYLFGSISKNQCHQFSDIDLVIKVKKEKTILEPEIIQEIRQFVLSKFHIESDIHIYDDFVEMNPAIKLLELF